MCEPIDWEIEGYVVHIDNPCMVILSALCLVVWAFFMLKWKWSKRRNDNINRKPGVRSRSGYWRNHHPPSHEMKLADTPSALIRQAMADLEICDRSDEYQVYMNSWMCRNRPITIVPEKCYVCLAGAVMAQSLGYSLPQGKFILMLGTPGAYDEDSPDLLGNEMVDGNAIWPEEVVGKLCALDSFRSGDIYGGIHKMGVTEYSVAKVDLISDKYQADLEKAGQNWTTDKFVPLMMNLAEDLEKIGL